MAVSQSAGRFHSFGVAPSAMETSEIGQKRKNESEKREKLANYETPIKMAENKIKSAKHTIEREQIEKTKASQRSERNRAKCSI